MGKRNQSKKWIRALLAAGVLGSLGTFPVMAEDLENTWIYGENRYDYINITGEVDPYYGINISPGAILTLTGEGAPDNELFTSNRSPIPDAYIKLDNAELHIDGEENTTYKIGKLLLTCEYEGPPYGVTSAISVEKGTLQIQNLYTDYLNRDTPGAGIYILTGNLIFDNINQFDGFGDDSLQFGSTTQAAHVSIKNQLAKQYAYRHHPDPDDPDPPEEHFYTNTRDIGLDGYVFLYSEGTSQENSTEVAVDTKARAPADYGPYNGDTGFGGNDNGNIILTNAKWQVGKNATLTFGTDDYTVAREVFKKTGLTWGTDHANGEVNAIVYVEKPVNFWGASAYARGGLYVDPNWTEKSDYFQFDDDEQSRQLTDRKVYLKNGSLLMIKGSAVEGDKPAAFLNVNADIRLEDDVNLFILDAEVGKKYNIF